MHPHSEGAYRLRLSEAMSGKLPILDYGNPHQWITLFARAGVCCFDVKILKILASVLNDCLKLHLKQRPD